MDGPESSKKASRGRPKKKPGYSKEQHVQDLIQQAVDLFCVPYDDRYDRPSDAPTIKSVAEAMHTTRVRVRKMLITAGYFSTAISRRVCELAEKGASMQEICRRTGLKDAAVNSYLPYERGVYNLSELSVNAELCKQFQLRKKICVLLQKNMRLEDEYAITQENEQNDVIKANYRYLWEAVLIFENYPFITENGNRIRYRIDGDCICIGDMKISRETIESLYFTIRKLQMKRGYVQEIEFLRYGGTAELYAIFLRLDVCEKENEKNLVSNLI